MARYTNTADVFSDIQRATVFTPLARFADVIRTVTDATRAIRRVQTSDINDSILSFVKRSEDLKRASRIIRANPGVFESRNQALAWSDKYWEMRRDVGGNRLETFRRKYGTIAGTDLFHRENTQLFTNRMAEIGRSPREQRIQDYYQQFGGSASPDAMDRAIQVVDAEDRADLHKRRIRGRKDFVYDTMSDERRELYDLTLKYGDRNLARRAMNENALRQFPWLRPLSQNIPVIGRNLPTIANALKRGAKAPIIGHFIKHPYMAAAGLAASTVMTSLREAAKIARLSATANMISVPTSGLLTAGHELAAWGGDASSIAKSISQFSGAQGAMFSGLGDTKHLHTLAAFGIDVRGSGKGGLLNYRERISKVQDKMRELHAAGDYDRMLYLAQTQGFDAPMIEATLKGIDLLKEDPIAKLLSSKSVTSTGEKINRLTKSPTDFLIESGRVFTKGNTMWNSILPYLGPVGKAIGSAANISSAIWNKFIDTDKAVSSVDSYNSSKEDGDKSIKPSNYSFSIGDISLPGVTDYSSFVSNIANLAADLLRSYSKKVIDSNESLEVN